MGKPTLKRGRLDAYKASAARQNAFAQLGSDDNHAGIRPDDIALCGIVPRAG